MLVVVVVVIVTVVVCVVTVGADVVTIVVVAGVGGLAVHVSGKPAGEARGEQEVAST